MIQAHNNIYIFLWVTLCQFKKRKRIGKVSFRQWTRANLKRSVSICYFFN